MNPRRPSAFVHYWLPASIILLTTAAAGQCAFHPRRRSQNNAHGKTLDRVVAVVNRRPILDSQVRQAAWYRLFSTPNEHRTALRNLDCRAALHHLILERLIAQAMPRGASSPLPEPQWRAWARQMGGMEHLRAQARKYHLTTGQLRRLAGRQYAMLRFMDGKFNPQIHISAAAERKYYQQIYLPMCRRKHEPAAALMRVRPLIRTILRQQALGRREQAWIMQLRHHARIGKLGHYGDGKTARQRVTARIHG